MNGDTESKKTILLVEDEALIALAESEMLERHGYTVITAAGGEAAVEAARSNTSIDLILMDIDLGSGMDGTGAAHIILGERDLPVVFLTSHTEKEAVQKTEKITSYGFVAKTSGEMVLLATIQMAFRLHHTHRMLKESEERYRMLVESSPAAILIHQNGIVRYGNQAAARTFGASSWEEFLGRNAIEAVHPDDRPMVAERMICMMETGEPAPLAVERFIGMDGRDIYMQVAGSRVRWEGCPASQVIGIDVTVPTLAERKIREAEERQRAFINAASDMAFIKDAGFRYLMVNRAYMEFLGRPEAEIIGKTDFDLMPHHGALGFRSSDEKALRMDSLAVSLETVDGRTYETRKFPVMLGSTPGVGGFIRDITEVRRIEEALRESESRYRQIFLHAPAGIYEVDFTRIRLTRVNSLICEYTGYTEAELLSMNPLEILTGESRERFLGRLEKMNRGESVPPDPEFCIRNKDGSTRWVQLNVEYSRKEGKITGATVVAHDISSRKLVDDALRESETKYRRLFELESDAILLVDNETGGLLEANEAACSLYGYTRDEILILHNFDLSAEPDETRRMTRERAQLIPVRYHRKKNGLVFPVEITANHYEWKGRPVHIAAIRDITFRIEAERALRESEEKYALIANHMADTITILDLDLNFVFISPSIVRLRGFTVEEALAQTIDQVLTPESLDIAARILKEELGLESDASADPARTRTMELEEYHKDGSTIWISNSISFIRGPDGRPQNILAVSRDITGRRRAEQALEQALEENQTLLHELRHRIKNSVAMIAGMVSLEAGRASGRETREALEDMRNRIISLAHLYDMMHISGDSRTVRLDDYIQRIVRSLSDTLAFDRDRITITARCDGTAIDAQRAALFGLILNELVTNAVKHAFPGGRSGAVLIESRSGGNEILLSVADNGVGPGNSFEPGKPEGLGMKLVNLLTRQMKGELCISGQGGATFSVRVPRDR